MRTVVLKRHDRQCSRGVLGECCGVDSPLVGVQIEVAAQKVPGLIAQVSST